MSGLRATNPSRNACTCIAAVSILITTTSGAAAEGGDGGWRDPCRAVDAARSAAIHELYERREREPVWLAAQGRTAAGRALVQLLDTAGPGVMTDCLERALAGSDGAYSRGELDVMLTDAYLVLSERRTGDGADVQDHLAALETGARERRQHRLDALARASAAPGRGPDPADEAARMAAAVHRYRRIAERGGWPRVAPGPALESGSTDPRVHALRERLAATGDLPSAVRERDDPGYDGALVRAVRRFQARHGLEPDGVVGPATREALNVPARRRLARMEINLRRIRQRVIDPEDTLLRVNIPAFRVTLHEAGRVTFSTRAIVGRPEHPTPQLRTRVTAITLNPPWNVPRTIVREDLARRFARDPGYAERRGFYAVNSDRALSAFDWSEAPMVAVRQAPGPANALGRIKFEMPNARAIYLHDTPEPQLFERRRRAFSAGCVRVEQPLQLAARVTGLDRERLERMVGSGDTRTVRLGWRVPVQLVYFTAWVNPLGRVQFRPDIYGRDDHG